MLKLLLNASHRDGDLQIAGGICHKTVEMTLVT